MTATVDAEPPLLLLGVCLLTRWLSLLEIRSVDNCRIFFNYENFHNGRIIWENNIMTLDLPCLGPVITARLPFVFVLSLCPLSAVGRFSVGCRSCDTQALIFPPASVKDGCSRRTTIPLSHLRKVTVNSLVQMTSVQSVPQPLLWLLV